LNHPIAIESLKKANLTQELSFEVCLDLEVKEEDKSWRRKKKRAWESRRRGRA